MPGCWGDMSALPAETAAPIRVATEADVDAIVCLINLAFRAESFCVSGDRTDRSDILARMGSGCFLVLDNTKADGLVAAVYCAVQGVRGYLGLLSIDPAAQGRGLARKMVLAVEENLREAGCNFVDLTVVNVREELFPIYQRLGFAANDVAVFPVPERALRPLHLVRMTKALRPPAMLAPPR